MTNAKATERLYWFFRMVANGGPDGSELDEAVWLDAQDAATWLEFLFEPPSPSPGF